MSACLGGIGCGVDGSTNGDHSEMEVYLKIMRMSNTLLPPSQPPAPYPIDARVRAQAECVL
mgnify:CR=1 FL=1